MLCVGVIGMIVRHVSLQIVSEEEEEEEESWRKLLVSMIYVSLIIEYD